MTLYNVREGLYDPRAPRPIAPATTALDLGAERDCELLSWLSFHRVAGPAARRIGSAIMDLAPPVEHPILRFTVRCQSYLPGDFPSRTPQHWHTDFARGSSCVDTRKAIHNYACITGEPRTVFLLDSGIELPDHRAVESFATALQRTPHAEFSLEPWSIVAFNATELHKAVAYSGQDRVERMFLRASYDPRVFG